jgi:hypothetical protein
MEENEKKRKEREE